MNVFVILLISVIAAVNSERFSDVGPNVFGYHQKIGIPKAAEIRKYEEAVHNAGKITGGSAAAIGAFPYQAGLVITINILLSSVCGASVLTNTKLVTAAHCWYDGVFQAQWMTVVLGSNYLFFGGTRIETRQVVMHENWDPATAYADIAIITVNQFEFTDLIQPISLPSTAELLNDFAGSSAIASGFGITSDSQQTVPISTVLHHVTLDVIENSECEQTYGPFVYDSVICTSGAGGKNLCGGDSGGPLAFYNYFRWILIGIGSYGSNLGCESGFPTAFTRVTSFIDWIQSRI